VIVLYNEEEKKASKIRSADNFFQGNK